MTRVAKKREVVKGKIQADIPEEIMEEWMMAEEGQILGVVRGELFGLFQKLLEKIMQLELSLQLGYGRYGKEQSGGNSRNGYRLRKKMIMEEGLMNNIKVPRDRNGNYQTAVLPRLKRHEPQLLDYVQQLYLNCNSTRPLSQMLTTLFDWPMSHGQVSRMSQELDGEVNQWLKRPLADKYIGFFLDAVWLPLRRFKCKSEKECMLLILGVTQAGYKEVVAMRLVAEESCVAWEGLLREIKQRGVHGKNLAIAVIDGLPGFRDVLLKTFPRLAIQRCVVHKERNVLRYVPHHSKEVVATELKSIYNAANQTDARRRQEAFSHKWRKTFPSAVRSLETDFEDSLTFLKIRSYQLRRQFSTNNPIERLNKEIKRRVRVMEMLPAEATAYRIVYWTFQKLGKKWAEHRVRGYRSLSKLKEAFTH